MNMIYKIDQSINMPGIIATAQALLSRREWLTPNLLCTNLNEVSVDFLHDERNRVGIKGIVLDLDNTISLPYQNQVFPLIADRLDELKEAYGDKIGILSNSAGIPTDKDDKLAKMVEQAFSIHVIRHSRKKPGCIEDVKDFMDIEDTSRIAVIGDRVLTDVVFARMHGMYAIKVEPLTPEGEPYLVRKIRPFEKRLMFEEIRKQGINPMPNYS